MSADREREHTEREPTKDAVALHEIRDQRAKGWPDFHPETYCHRCGRRNITSWFVDRENWREAFPQDAVAAVGDHSYSTAEKAFNGIVCPSCFTALHERETGRVVTWMLIAMPEPIVPSPEERPMPRDVMIVKLVEGIKTHIATITDLRVRLGEETGHA